MSIFMKALQCGDRVRELRTLKGWSQTKLAKAAGTSQVTISNIENDVNEDSKKLPPVAKALGVSVDYLLYGSTHAEKTPSLDEFVVIGEGGGQTPSAGEYVLVPQFDIHGSCGEGSVIENIEIKGALVFNKRWLREHGLPDGNDLRVIYAKGESMYPTIETGQVLLINPHDKTPKSNKIYFLCIDGQFYVKRLINMVTHWVVRSDNSDKLSWPDINLSAEDLKKVEIEGRVVWRGGSL